MRQPFLEGVRVVDLSQLVPGPACTWILAGMGANVDKVEPPGGDPLRHVPPMVPGRNHGAWFDAINAGKSSTVLDLRLDADKERLRALVAAADVVVEGFRPGTLAKLGFDPQDLLARHPHLVIASLSGYGQSGPWSARPGHDLNYAAVAGLLTPGAHVAGRPAVPGAQVADWLGGAYAGALAIAAALYARTKTGRGAWLDLALADLTAPAMAMAAAQAAVGHPVSPGGDVLTGGLAQYGVYRCADGKFLAVAPLEPKFWQELKRVVPDADPVRDVLELVFATRARDAWVDLLAQACVAPVLDLEEILAHPLLRARGWAHGEGAEARLAPPLAAVALGPAPDLGEARRAS